LIQRNPSRPGVSHLLCQRQNRFLVSRLAKGKTAKEACRSFLGKESSETPNENSSDFDIRRPALKERQSN
jgi:hypothetical protein